MKKPYDYLVKKIGTGMWLINERLSTMYIIEGSSRALVIDCGAGVGDFRGLVESLTSLPFDLVATHAHVDHIGGRGQFDELNISAVDAKRIKSVGLPYRRFYFCLNTLTNRGVYDRDTISIERTKNEPRVKIVREGSVFDLGGRTLEVFETPGHTAGSISLLLREERMMFTGDVANSFNFMFLKGATSIETMAGTLDRLYNIPGYDIFWPSHVEDSSPKDEILKVRDAAARLCETKDSPVPAIGDFRDNDVRIIYRKDRVHEGGACAPQ